MENKLVALKMIVVQVYHVGYKLCGGPHLKMHYKFQILQLKLEEPTAFHIERPIR